jgi:1,4-alpha-glucan branching enzyme
VNVAFVLHSHLPWLRRNGTHPVGEEWLFQSWSESYLPLVDTLERLAAAGARDLLTIGISPVLAEQMDDPYLLREFHGWLGRRLVDLQYSHAGHPEPNRTWLTDVWTHHWRRQTRLLETVETRYLATGLTAPFRALADAGIIELLGGPATHPYLPLADDPALIRSQLAAGLATHERTFGHRPRGVWTPECGYRPEGTVADPTRPPRTVSPDGVPELHRGETVVDGLEAFWTHAGISHLVLDAPTLTRAAGAGGRRWAEAGGRVDPPGGPMDVLDRPGLVGDSDLAVFGRNLAVSYVVWNPHGGYPADPAYRDFYAIDNEGGFKSWRVTDRASLDKAPYVPAAARERAVVHAEEFVRVVRRHAEGRPAESVVVAAYDTELFGHWWYEGPVWLEAVLRRLCDARGLRPTTLSSYLDRHPPARRLALPESSWGWGKGHGAWVSKRTRWMWQAVRDAERRFNALAADAPGRDAAWRQLALLQASDWPFMVIRDQSAQYAEERVRGHLERFDAACRGEGLAALSERDDPWGTAAPAAEPVG